MAGGIARAGDIFGPGGVLTAPVSNGIFVNGRPAAIIGISYTPHPCCGAKKCPPSHCFGFVFDVPAGVYFNGIPVVTGSGVGTCGHKVMTKSEDVLVVGGGLAGTAISLITSRALSSTGGISFL